MVGRLFLLLIFLALCLSYASNDTVFADVTIPDLEPQTTPYFLADIQYEVLSDHTNVLIGINEKTDFVYYTLDDPYRIVIDLIGVVFCELEEVIEIDEGPLKKITIVEDKTVPRPAGLDKYFYAVDYIVIELKGQYSFNPFYSKDGKVIVAQIQSKAPVADLAKKKEKPSEEPLIIEDVEYEVNPQSSILAISSNKSLKTTIYEQYNPYQIVVTPADTAHCELEEKLEPVEGLVKSVIINRDTSAKEPKGIDKFFYPVKNIIIEPVVQLPFNVHTADDGRITIVRIEKSPAKTKAAETKIAEKSEVKAEQIKPQPPEAVQAQTAAKREIAEAKEKAPEPMPAVAEKTGQEPIAEPLATSERQSIVDEITQKLYIKQQEFFTKIEEREGRRRAIREARDKARAIRAIEKIGMEELEDLMVKGKGIATLGYCKNMAVSYSEPAAIAEEEMKLSGMKLKENFRALFPSAKIKASQTSGDVLGVDFIEKLYGVEAEYPVYQGGKLWNAYQQSKVNLNLSKARYDKVVNDLNYKVAETYYGVVTAVMNLKLQQGLLKKVEEILKIAQKRRSTDLSTDLELFNVKSQYNQVQFQLASAERDLALARFKLEQAMNADIAGKNIELGEVETELGFEIVDINLKKCLELAQDYHPDILVNELLVESNQYEEKITKAKESLSVNLTGFFGRSGSHYKTEADKMYKDWNIGVKVSKPFWGNTAAYSFTKEETRRKVGQTDRQSTVVNSGEFSILDAMSASSDIKEAAIKRHKSENDLLDARRQVNLEVKEAYYNFQEAVIQVKNALEKVRFEQEAVKTAKLQSQLNEALQSQLLEAEIKLADERSVYIKALSDYNFSIAKLNKAIGIEGYFSLKEPSEGVETQSTVSKGAEG